MKIFEVGPFRVDPNKKTVSFRSEASFKLWVASDASLLLEPLLTRPSTPQERFPATKPRLALCRGVSCRVLLPAPLWSDSIVPCRTRFEWKSHSCKPLDGALLKCRGEK